MDQNMQYFIFTGISIEKGRPYTRMRWRQADPTPNTEPNMVKLAIPQPITVKIKYCMTFYLAQIGRALGRM